MFYMNASEGKISCTSNGPSLILTFFCLNEAPSHHVVVSLIAVILQNCVYVINM